MSDWKKHFNKYASIIDDRFDDLVIDFRRRLGSFRPLQIVPYRSYGTARHVYVKGRVLEDKKIAAATDKDTVLNNILNMYKRFESNEVPGAVLKANVEGELLEVTTDNEGYFVLDITPKEPIIAESLWHQVPLELMDAPIPHEKGITAFAEVMIPPPDAEYGIISDIDDTIVRTTATDVLAMSRTTFLNNARTRLPFAGVAEFYSSLQLGRNGKRNNPFFYVSSSPWNLYDLLKDFLDLNKIPAGPLLLRDFGLSGESVAGGGHMGHKFKEIKQIFDAYPHLNFVLVGDSGQEDPVIYQEVVKQFPNRVLAIYIRDVQLADREKIAVDISRSLAEHKVEMVVVDNTVEAAEHAAKAGLIYTEAIPAIEEEKKEDKGQKPGKEDATVA
jgi:phosphatidate phosphatase APP1